LLKLVGSVECRAVLLACTVKAPLPECVLAAVAAKTHSGINIFVIFWKKSPKCAAVKKTHEVKHTTRVIRLKKK
jgi:hypothetical protein